MATSTISGIDLILSVNDIAIGCAQTIDLEVKTETSSATCRASGGWAEVVAGRHSWTASTSGLYRIATAGDVATNMTLANLQALQIARTPVAIEFGSETVGDQKVAGNAIITSVKRTAPETGAGTFAVSFEGTGPLTFTTNV
jgi:predicted secreted protein